QLFDPKNLFNPGKIFDDGRFKIDNHLRVESERTLRLPFEPTLAFAFKDESFIGNLEQCNGCGGCRKDAPTMCPTFLATGEKYMRKTLGLTDKRPLPHYAKQRFDRWFPKHVAAVYDRRNGQAGSAVIDRRYRGEVILWDDTFVRYHEPHIGIAAVKVLEALGF